MRGLLCIKHDRLLFYNELMPVLPIADSIIV